METGLYNADSLRSITESWKCKNTRLRNVKTEQILEWSPQIRHKEKMFQDWNWTQTANLYC